MKWRCSYCKSTFRASGSFDPICPECGMSVSESLGEPLSTNHAKEEERRHDSQDQAFRKAGSSGKLG